MRRLLPLVSLASLTLMACSANTNIQTSQAAKECSKWDDFYVEVPDENGEWTEEKERLLVQAFKKTSYALMPVLREMNASDLDYLHAKFLEDLNYPIDEFERDQDHIRATRLFMSVESMEEVEKFCASHGVMLTPNID